jgi:hypothetical protein
VHATFATRERLTRSPADCCFLSAPYTYLEARRQGEIPPEPENFRDLGRWYQTEPFVLIMEKLGV